jgi:hypothetical protein
MKRCLVQLTLQMFIGDADERRRLLWNAFYFGLWKELAVIICSRCHVVLISFILIRKNQVYKYVVIFVFDNFM